MSRYARARKRADGATIEGRHAVLEALRAGAQVECVLIATEAHFGRQLSEITALAKQAGAPVKRLPRRQLDARSATKKAQGVIALIPNRKFAKLEELLTPPAPLLIAVLDGVQDPQNLGAIARALEAAGGRGLVIRQQRSVGLTPGAVRASAGALEHLQVARVASIPQAVKTAREHKLQTVGLDMRAPKRYDEIKLRERVAVLVGGEERGVSKAALAECDAVVRLPQRGKIGSLNASVAAGLMFYEWLRAQRLDE